jgi:hypothetical protein
MQTELRVHSARQGLGTPDLTLQKLNNMTPVTTVLGVGKGPELNKVRISPMVTDGGETGAITFSFRLSVGTMLRQLSPKPTMYISQQMQIGRFKSDFCTLR